MDKPFEEQKPIKKDGLEPTFSQSDKMAPADTVDSSSALYADSLDCPMPAKAEEHESTGSSFSVAEGALIAGSLAFGVVAERCGLAKVAALGTQRALGAMKTAITGFEGTGVQVRALRSSADTFGNLAGKIQGLGSLKHGELRNISDGIATITAEGTIVTRHFNSAKQLFAEHNFADRLGSVGQIVLDDGKVVRHELSVQSLHPKLWNTTINQEYARILDLNVMTLRKGNQVATFQNGQLVSGRGLFSSDVIAAANKAVEAKKTQFLRNLNGTELARVDAKPYA